MTDLTDCPSIIYTLSISSGFSDIENKQFIRQASTLYAKLQQSYAELQHSYTKLQHFFPNARLPWDAQSFLNITGYITLPLV